MAAGGALVRVARATRALRDAARAGDLATVAHLIGERSSLIELVRERGVATAADAALLAEIRAAGDECAATLEAQRARVHAELAQVRHARATAARSRGARGPRLVSRRV